MSWEHNPVLGSISGNVEGEGACRFPGAGGCGTPLAPGANGSQIGAPPPDGPVRAGRVHPRAGRSRCRWGKDVVEERYY